jgi:hypothetical protein
MIRFQESALNETERTVARKARRIQRKIQEYDLQLNTRLGKGLTIDFIEHSHYIYGLRSISNDLTEQDHKMIQKREKQFQNDEFPSENIYKGIIKILDFISVLMIRWKLFDINNYGYRYKGRSLTVKVIDMKSINEKCVNINICWFSFAITHQPFFGKIDKVILCYAKVLQMQINNVINFFRQNHFNNCSLNIVPWWKVFSKTDPLTQELYQLLKGVEFANRYFEKSLIQEFLRIV